MPKPNMSTDFRVKLSHSGIGIVELKKLEQSSSKQALSNILGSGLRAKDVPSRIRLEVWG
jgi:hypothetical protein